MARLGESGDLIKCSFCGRSQAHIKKLIAGPGVYICDECVDLCCEIMMHEGVFDPQQRYADFDAKTYLEDWIDNTEPEDVDRIRETRALLERLLAQLGSKASEKVETEEYCNNLLYPEDP